ncbi:hypothetical protein U9M48_044629, partial [Paspalum notatum var. saurae]
PNSTIHFTSLLPPLSSLIRAPPPPHVPPPRRAASVPRALRAVLPPPHAASARAAAAGTRAASACRRRAPRSTGAPSGRCALPSGGDVFFQQSNCVDLTFQLWLVCPPCRPSFVPATDPSKVGTEPPSAPSGGHLRVHIGRGLDSGGLIHDRGLWQAHHIIGTGRVQSVDR